MTKDVFVAGASMTAFGRNGISMQDLAQASVTGAMRDANVTAEQIQAIYAANVYGGMVLGQVLMRDLGITGPALYNVENACASGATAVHLACQALKLGLYETVVVFGVEALTQLGGGTIPMQRNDYKTDLYAKVGMTLPTVYAMRGTRYLYERNESPDLLARIAVKNRANGVRNPLAQQRTAVTIEEVLTSRPVAEPLTLLQCCPSMVDGAAAVVLTTRRPTHLAKPVRIMASAIQSGHQEVGCDDILDAEITARTARLAYEQAGVNPRDIDMVELHDAFTIAELLYYEALQLAKPGEGGALLRAGETELGGRVPVNPSGGLLAKGHPLGATGVAQMVEVVWQLQGRAEGRQIENGRLGLTQCTGGGIAGVDHAASAVHILGV
ncbi:thiolase family protein [Rhizobium leguminosarum]|uniref:thiolase family protein n=1 Tax=Rhizobium TaxID=379 RepID=UPI00103132D1|nr:thiolase family protein [Rhizobium leguminosarum]TBF87472.1 thiolase family protein [Rhizobium leguminosarum]TBG07017.1 thiolase family protein [Rhizobium leguminosarum]TBG07331.1 thiolase family protein [Rhizobium leguminosarum]TBG30708.1 thiolase family protein [Rhizobium leguminosarum]TBG49701.1 thiolase family protein [Rhizobium leguminosarum]